MPESAALTGNPWGAIAQFGSGLLSSGIGLIQRGQANRWLKNNQQPIETIPDEVNQAASVGLPAEQYQQAMKNIQRQQLDALSRANDRRGGLATISALQQGSNDAIGNLDAQNAQARIAGKQALASWKSRLFKQNTLDPYNRRRDEIMGQLGSGNQNLVGGVDKLLAGGGQYFSSGGFDGDGNGGSSGGNTTGNGLYGGINTNYLLNNRFRTGRF